MKKMTLTLMAAFAATAAIAEGLEDSDGDGMYSLEEVQAAFPDVTDDGFAIADTSGDGMLDADELAAAQDAGLIPA